MRTHLSWSSGLDGMPLMFDAFRECSVLAIVCLAKWVRLSALHVIASWLELHTLTPSPDKLGIRAGLFVGLSKPWSKSSLALYSYIVTLGIREQRKAYFSPYPHRSEFWITLIFSIHVWHFLSSWLIFSFKTKAYYFMTIFFHTHWIFLEFAWWHPQAWYFDTPRSSFIIFLRTLENSLHTKLIIRWLEGLVSLIK